MSVQISLPFNHSSFLIYFFTSVSSSIFVMFFSGRNQRVVFTAAGLVFAKECEFLLVSLGEGFGAGSGGWWGGCPVENKGKGEEVREGFGVEGGGKGDRQRNRQVNA